MATAEQRRTAIRNAGKTMRRAGIRPMYAHNGCPDCDGYGRRRVRGWRNNGHDERERHTYSVICETCEGELRRG